MMNGQAQGDDIVLVVSTGPRASPSPRKPTSMSILRLGERLVRSGAITSEQLDLLAAEQKRSGQRLTQLVVELGFASAERVAETVAEISGSPYLPLQQQSIAERAGGPGR